MADETAVSAQESEVTSVQSSEPATDFNAQVEQWRLDLMNEVTQDGTETATEDQVQDQDQNPQEQTAQDDQAEADNDKPLSRREAHRIAEERLKQLQESEQQKAELQKQLDERAKADEELGRDVQRALGTDEEYKDLERRARAGDRDAGRALDQIDANRQFYGKLLEKSARDIQGFFVNGLVEEANKIGMKQDTLYKGTPAQIVKEAFELGQQAKEKELEPTLTELRAEAKGTRAATVSRRNGAVLEGGRSASGTPLDNLFGNDGLPTEEAIQAAKRGELMSV